MGYRLKLYYITVVVIYLPLYFSYARLCILMAAKTFLFIGLSACAYRILTEDCTLVVEISIELILFI